MTWKKTKTLSDSSGNPLFTIYPGHVGSSIFNYAFKSEGWKSDWIKKENLNHEYIILNKRSYHRCGNDDSNKRAKPFTVMVW